MSENESFLLLAEELKSRLREGRLQAVLFDMDGVLYDSMKNHAESWYRTACQYGFTATREEFYLYEGQTGAQTIDGLCRQQRGREATEEEICEIYHTKSSIFETLGKAPVMPGAVEVLEAVGRLGLQCVVVTGSGQASLLSKLEVNFPGVFSPERIVSAKDTPVGCGKPHPAPYLMGLRKAGNLSALNAIVVENAPLGVRAARAAGIFTIAVNTGPLAPEILSREGASVVLPDMMTLARLFSLCENTNL